MRWRRFLGPAALVGFAAVSCGADGPAEPEVLVDLPDASPGETVGLVARESADGARAVEWIDRTSAQISRLEIDDPEAQIESFVALPVGPDGEVSDPSDGDQRGVLGHALIDGRRFVSWTRPGSFELVVGELLADGSQRIVWSAGEAGDGAIGGVLQATDDDALLIGIGRNTQWDTATGLGGAILRLDPDAEPDQSETTISTGYTNPWAYTPVDGGAIWVADNAAGPDPDDPSRDDVERIGRADLQPDRNEMDAAAPPERAPAAMVELSDDRVGICGFLDNALVAYDPIDTDAGTDTGLRPGDTIMPCTTGAVVFEDGTVVTAGQTDSGEALFILRP